MSNGERAYDVLLVEGNPVDGRLLQGLLAMPEGELFALQEAGSVSAALEHLTRQPFAAVLLDLALPDGEGLDVIRRVHAASPETSIVALTDHENSALATQAMQAGAQDTLFKSDVNSRVLARALRYAIERQRLQGALQAQAEALAASEARLRTLIDATPDLVCFKDGEGRWLEANAATLKLFQLEGVDYRGRTNAELAEASPLWRDVLQNDAASDEAAWQTGANTIGQETIATPDGPRVYEMIKAPLFQAGGQRRGLVVLGRDITRHTQAEQSLAQERDLLQALMDNIPDTIYFKDTASRFTRINRAQAQTLQVADPKDAIGKSDFDFFSGEFVQTAYHDEQEIFRSGRPLIGKIEEVRRPDGMRRWVSATKMPIRSQTGEVIGLVGLSRDISEIQQRERELEVIASVSAALRSASNRAEMMPIILDQVLTLLEASAASFIMVDPVTGELETELTRGSWARLMGRRLSIETSLSAEVLTRARPYWNNDAAAEPRLAESGVDAQTRAQLCVPLITQDHALGVLWAARQSEITETDVHLLSAIGNIAANAIHRATLHEQTEQQLRYLGALRTIDAAISGSIDLRLTLRVLLDQVTAQLHVHAAAVLMLDPRSQTLYYAEGRGFLSAALRETRLHVGRGHAGRAALERRVISVPNLAEAPEDRARQRLLAGEKFVAYYAAPLIAKGQVKGILEVFHREPLAGGADWLDFLETLASQAAIAIDNASMFEEQQRSNVELRHTNIELTLAFDRLVEQWAAAVEQHNREPQDSTLQAAELAVALGRALNLAEGDLAQLRRGALLHDVGELAVADSILRKPGPLAAEEWEAVRRHPAEAAALLAPVALVRPALDLIHAHHEKWDGSGYPRGLQGEQIPLTARIFAVADVWQALRSDRPHRPAWSIQAAETWLREQTGRHFDPQVMSAFWKVLAAESAARESGESPADER
jgi:PAS domain S-box-containing protein